MFEAAGMKIYSNPENESHIADLYDKTSDFKIVHQRRGEWIDNIEDKRKAFFAFKDGNLLRYCSGSKGYYVEEYMYLHLHNRQMRINDGVLGATEFGIVPNTFITLPKIITMDNVHRIRIKYPNLHYFRLRFKNLKTKMKRKLRKRNNG